MTSVRKRKAAICRALLRINRIRSSSIDDLLLWDQARPVGREWGSPDFERLMEEDCRNGVGIFEHALRSTELEALADAAKGSAERACAAIDDALGLVEASNKRIAAMEKAAKRGGRNGP